MTFLPILLYMYMHVCFPSCLMLIRFFFRFKNANRSIFDFIRKFVVRRIITHFIACVQREHHRHPNRNIHVIWSLIVVHLYCYMHQKGANMCSFDHSAISVFSYSTVMCNRPYYCWYADGHLRVFFTPKTQKRCLW